MMVPMSAASSPGRFNDLDVIGINSGMSPNELATQIVFWAASKSVRLAEALKSMNLSCD